jgi:predicted PurR-regulated permease PerM
VVSIIIAGVLLANTAGGSQAARAFATRLAGERGTKAVEPAGATVRSVAQGVLDVDVPMLVIFIGAIGGFMASGIIGLFVGAIIFALGYKLVLTWLYVDTPNPESHTEPDRDL